jgi:hypothetical protein
MTTIWTPPNRTQIAATRALTGSLSHPGAPAPKGRLIDDLRTENKPGTYKLEHERSMRAASAQSPFVRQEPLAPAPTSSHEEN